VRFRPFELRFCHGGLLSLRALGTNPDHAYFFWISSEMFCGTAS